jgi:hypothetical protein
MQNREAFFISIFIAHVLTGNKYSTKPSPYPFHHGTFYRLV